MIDTELIEGSVTIMGSVITVFIDVLRVSSSHVLQPDVPLYNKGRL